jgi:hypothetical protein
MTASGSIRALSRRLITWSYSTIYAAPLAAKCSAICSRFLVAAQPLAGNRPLKRNIQFPAWIGSALSLFLSTQCPKGLQLF